MTTFISGGVATFEQSRKLAEYENRKASITFNVTSDADATQTVIDAMAIAKQYVFKALGLGEPEISKSPPPRTGFEEKVLAGAVKPAEKAETAPAAVSSPAVAAKATRARKPAVVVVDSGKPAGDPTDLTGGVGAAPGAPGGGLVATSAVNDPTALDFMDAPKPAAAVMSIPEPVTDAHLTDACTRKVTALGGAAKVKVLVNTTYGATHVSAIPTEKRKQFLIDLENLK